MVASGETRSGNTCQAAIFLDYMCLYQFLLGTGIGRCNPRRWPPGMGAFNLLARTWCNSMSLSELLARPYTRHSADAPGKN